MLFAWNPATIILTCHKVIDENVKSLQTRLALLRRNKVGPVVEEGRLWLRILSTDISNKINKLSFVD